MQCQSFPRIRLAILMLFALLSTPLVAATPAADEVSVVDAYVRTVPPGQPNSAAFMQLHNNSATSHAIVKAQSPVSKVVELHTHIMEDGMMKMRQVAQIDVPAQGSTTLAPGGLHVMLIGLTADLTPEQRVPVTLIFEDGSQTTIQAPVRKLHMHCLLYTSDAADE